MRKATYLVIMALLALGKAAAYAQVDVQERKDIKVNQDLYRDVAGELRCPTCTGLSVLDSEATFSVQIKNQVREQLSEGRSREEVLKFFVDRYGPWILRAPPVQGVNALAWLVPAALLVVGPILIWAFVWRRRPVLTAEVARPSEDIAREMKDRLTQMRAGKAL